MTEGLSKVSGVYAIVHLASGKLYVGSAVNIARRWSIHCLHLSRNTHHSRRLQNAWNKHGKDAFVFVVVRFCPVADLISEEQRWLDETDAAGRHGYNSSPTAGSPLGVKHTLETRAKLSAAQRGRKHTLETRAKLVAAMKGRMFTPEHRANVAAAATGRKMSPEAVAKMASAQRGKKLTPEHRAKAGAARRGMKHSDEYKAKMSETLRGRKLLPESIAKREATKRAKKRARMSMVQGELFT